MECIISDRRQHATAMNDCNVNSRETMRLLRVMCLSFPLESRGEKRLLEEKYRVDPPRLVVAPTRTPTFKLVSSTGLGNLRHRWLYTYPALLPASMIHPETA